MERTPKHMKNATRSRKAAESNMYIAPNCTCKTALKEIVVNYLVFDKNNTFHWRANCVWQSCLLLGDTSTKILEKYICI